MAASGGAGRQGRGWSEARGLVQGLNSRRKKTMEARGVGEGAARPPFPFPRAASTSSPAPRPPRPARLARSHAAGTSGVCTATASRVIPRSTSRQGLRINQHNEMFMGLGRSRQPCGSHVAAVGHIIRWSQRLCSTLSTGPAERLSISNVSTREQLYNSF